MVDLSGPALLDLLEPDVRNWLAGLGNRRSYADGELLHARGDPSPSMEIVISGAIRLVRLRQDGSQSFVTTIGPGQHIADVLLLHDRPRSHSAFAIGEVTVDHYDRAAFNQLIGREEVLLALYRISAVRLNTALTMIDDLRTLPREAHLAKLLLALMRESDGKVDVVQEDLASILGVSAMTLAKSLAVLKQQGLIETGYRKLWITDRERLKVWLGEQESD